MLSILGLSKQGEKGEKKSISAVDVQLFRSDRLFALAQIYVYIMRQKRASSRGTVILQRGAEPLLSHFSHWGLG